MLLFFKNRYKPKTEPKTRQKYLIPRVSGTNQIEYNKQNNTNHSCGFVML